MTKVLLCSETFIKEHTNLSDNLSGAYLGPAIRETQDIELTEYLGSALVDKLCELVSSGTITETANAKYKAILDQAQYFLAYSSIAKVIPICSIKLDNFGASQSQDENIRTLGIEDLSTVTGWYQKKADTYAKKLMRYVLSVKSEIPELNECAAGQIKSHLNSAASTGLFLGGSRGRKVGSGGSCCGGTSGGHSGGGGEGSVVTWEQTVTGGTKIATISIDGKSTEVFVPEGISEEEVSELISQAIETETARTESTYAKTGTTEDLDERLTDVESELAGLEVPSVYYIDGDSINNYSDVVDEIYRKLASGETVFVGSKYDYAKFPVGKAEIYEYQESDPSNPSEYLRREGFSVPVTRTDGVDSYLLRYGTFSAFRYEGRDGEGHSAGLSWNENTLAISPLTLTAKISTGGTIYMNAKEDNNSNNLDKLYRLTKDSRNGIIMAKVYDLRINSAIGYTPVRFLGASSGNNDFYSFAKFTFDYTDTDGKTYRTLWTWDRSQPAATRIVLDSCEEVSEGGVAQYDLDAMSQSERAAFVAMCENLTELEREELLVYRDKSICRYDHTEGSGNSFKIGFFDYRQDGWSYPLTYFRHFFVKADGTYESQGNSTYPNIITYDTAYSDTAHTLSNTDGMSPLMPISNLNARSDGKVAINLRLIIQRSSPAKVVLSSKAWSERTGNLEGRICAEWHYSGNVITAVWNVVGRTATISSWTEVPEGGSGGGDYVVVESLSAITNPTEGMVAFVKGTIAVDRLANVSAYKLSGWAGGMYQFVAGEDYTIHRSQINNKWNFPYKSGTPDIGYYWQELDSNLYIRYQGGNIWVAWNSENFPNARMMGNNFTNSDNKWGETSGQTFYITLNHSEGLNQYRDGKWVPMKKQYWFQDCISSSALSEEICHRTAEGEMDITLVENDGVMTCQYSSPNSWNVGSTAFVMLRVDTNSNHLQYFRKFVNWDSYNWAQDANWDYTLPQSSGLHTKPIFRDYWYVYYDTTTSGFSYGIDQTLTPITWGTGTTCSGMWIFDKDGTYQYLGSPVDVDKAFFFNLRVKTSEGTRIYGYPSFSRVVLDTPVTLTNEQSESITFSDKVYFDYGDCVLSFYFNNDWRFGGIEINFR